MGILPRILGMGSAKSKSCERRRSNGNLLVRIRAMTGFTRRRALESGGSEMVAGDSVINRILFATDFSTCARHAEEHVVFQQSLRSRRSGRPCAGALSGNVCCRRGSWGNG